MLEKTLSKLSGGIFKARTSHTAPNGTATMKERQLIAHDTVDRSQSIIEQHSAEGATSDSTFFADQFPPLDKTLEIYPSAPASIIKVVNSDSFTAARGLFQEFPEAKGTTAVLNLASDLLPAGGWWFILSKTQEEALCYCSTLYITLKESYYPWPNVGPGSVCGVFSPGVVIFKDDLDNNCKDLELEERRVVSVITVAAPRLPELTEDRQEFKNASDKEYLQGKIRFVYRMAAHMGQHFLVLGAIGCGAYGCPPQSVAEQMKTILLEPEFHGWFKQIVFAVYKVRDTGTGSINFDIFSEAFESVKTY